MKKTPLKIRLLKAARAALYWPLEHLSYLPGGLLHYMWLVRLVVKLDEPLMIYLIRGFNARNRER